MKLQISFDIPDLEKSLALAAEVEMYADTIEIGTLLLYSNGIKAITQFRERFSNKPLFVDTKIMERSKDTVTLCAQAGADWVTVMAGAGKQVIHTACTVAHEFGKKVMLDTTDASSLGQTALEAQSLGADAILFHQPLDEDERIQLVEYFDMVKGNTSLPIFIAAPVSRQNIGELLSVSATGIIIGNPITQSKNPREEAAYFSELIHTK